MDKTYAETQGKAPFDWNLFLKNPPEVGSEEHKVAKTLASMWPTCACGNQCAIIPRRYDTEPTRNGSPNDPRLKALGHEFYAAIFDARWPAARATMAAIEARSAVLIQQELAKLNQ